MPVAGGETPRNLLRKQAIEPPKSPAAFSALMATAAVANRTLFAYTYPSAVSAVGGTEHFFEHWVPYTSGCEIAANCYCYHVQGDMSREHNPDGWRRCYGCKGVNGRDDGRRCRCLRGSSCLFSDMRPTKILAAVTAARLADVTHIIEEGRFGGLSAAMYALHGFRVTSVEFLPLTGTTDGLNWWNSVGRGSKVTMLNGNGSQIIPQLVSQMSRKEAAQTMVIFDGEKRFEAYRTYKEIKSQVALAIFDDTNIKDGPRFKIHLQQKNEIWWHTEDSAWDNFLPMEAPALELLKPLNVDKMAWQGGINKLDKFHFSIVVGGGWGSRHKQ